MDRRTAEERVREEGGGSPPVIGGRVGGRGYINGESVCCGWSVGRQTLWW